MSVLKYSLVVRDPDGQAVALLEGTEVPEWASSLVHADDLDGAGDAGQTSGDLGATKADLQAEIDRRNADRAEDEQIKPEGKNKPDLAAALAADDQTREV